MRSVKEDTRKASAQQSRRKSHSDVIWAIVFLAPALIAILTMRIVPGISAAYSSLFKALPGGLSVPKFDGLGNYVKLFSNPEFIDTLVRTIVFNVIINPVQVMISLALAVLMTRRLALQGVWRTLLFIPATIPIVGSSIAWGAGMRQDGPINAVIKALGGKPQPFFTSPSQSLFCVGVVATWVGVGYWMIFLIAGLEDIPTEYYEAASIDRAGPFRTFFSVTVPLLKRQLLFVLVSDTVANFVLFVPIQMLTNGGPQNSSTVLMFDAYRTTFTFSSRNLGSAEVVILMIVMLAAVGIQFLLLREGDDR